MDRRVCPSCFCPHDSHTRICRKGGCNTKLDYFDVDVISSLANRVAHDYELANRPPPQGPRRTSAKIEIPDVPILVATYIILELGKIGYGVFIKEPVEKRVRQLQRKLLTWLKRKRPFFRDQRVPIRKIQEFIDSPEARIEIIERTIERRYNITVRKRIEHKARKSPRKRVSRRKR